MAENQPLIDELIAAAGGDVGFVDIANPVDVESFLTSIVMGANKLSDAEFSALSNEAQTWLNDVAQAMNAKGNLADAAFTEDGLQLADLPSTSAPVPTQAADGGSDAPAEETPPSAPEVRPEPQEAADAAGEEEIPPSALVSRPGAQKDSKTSGIFIRFHVDEKERLRAFAEQNGISLTKLIREAALACAESE